MMPATANATYVNGVDTFFGDNVHVALGVDGAGNARSHIVWDGTNLVIDVDSDAGSAAALNLLGGVFQKAGVEVPTENDITTALATASAGSTFASILGAVGQGAIVDVIENSDGTAVRWESGLQLVYGSSTGVDATAVRTSGVYRSSATGGEQADITWPAAFIDNSVQAAVVAKSGTGVSDSFANIQDADATSAVGRVFNVDSSVTGMTLTWVAVGMWK